MIKLLRLSFKSHSFSSSSPSSSSSSPSSSSPSSPSQSLSLSQSFIEETISNAEQTITKWHPNASLHENRIEAKEFLSTIKQLQKSMQFIFLSGSSNSQNLIRSQGLMQIAMDRLQTELDRILSSNRCLLDPESFSTRFSERSFGSDFSYDDTDAGTGDETQIGRENDRASAIAASDLHSIAKCMISVGYGIECVRIYKLSRQSIIDEALHRVGFERMSPNQVQKLDWEIVEGRITNWLAAARIAVRNLFSGERILCDQVFAGAGAIKESCFAEISKDAASDLFRFPESVAVKCKKSPEKMFRVLDLYDSLSDLLPEIESIFSYESTSAVRLQALSSLLKLREQVRNMFSDFESELQKDPPRSPVPGGGLHPLTSYVMNYLSFMGNYSGILAEIFADLPFQVQNPFFQISTTAANDPLSSIAARIAWLILVLLCKINAKAELYKDVSLSYLFLANNLHHVMNEVKKSEIGYLLGDDWVSNHEAKVAQYAATYERAAWGKVVSELPDDPTAEIPAEKVKEAFQRFSSAFEKTYRIQRDWIVPDEMMREHIKVSVVKRVVPAYRAFFKKHQVLFRDESDFGDLVRFTPMDLENYFSELFSGSLRSQMSP
ncbi:hypothetical protein AAC387_Pa07g3656 [Persea americana]